MPIYVTERPKIATESQHLRPEATHEYVISGSKDKLTIQLAAINNIPPTVNAINFDGDTTIVLFLENIALKEEGGGVWLATAKYGSSSDVVDLQFNFTSTSAKIYQAIEHIRQFDCISGGIDTGFVPQYNGTIGVNGDEVEGVDVEVSVIEFTLTKKYRRALLDVTYFQQLVDLMDVRTPVNDGQYIIDWKGIQMTFPEGGLRLRGCPIKWTSNDELEIAYQFAYQRAIKFDDLFTIGNSAAIYKEGWEYGWVSYKLAVSNGATTRTPQSYNVEQVYPKRDFTVLEL